MKINLADIVEQTGCEIALHGSNITEFSGVAPLNLAKSDHVSFLVNEKYIEEAKETKAGVILCSKKTVEYLIHKEGSFLLVCDDPYAAFAKVSQSFFKPQHPFSGISNQAIIDVSAKIHPSATIFPFVFVGPGAHICENSIIYSGCFIGAASTIGRDCILYPNVVVREGCTIGDRCIFNPGVVVGGDGFGFAPTAKENVKIPQIGGVDISDDVELGANTTVDRGAMANTKIGRQTKVDNLVMIAHNVEIGEFCFIAGNSAIAGSSSIGNRSILAGQVGIIGHLKIGNNVTITAQSGVSKNISDGQVWGGSPAKPHKEYAISLAILNKLTNEKMKKNY